MKVILNARSYAVLSCFADEIIQFEMQTTNAENKQAVVIFFIFSFLTNAELTNT